MSDPQQAQYPEIEDQDSIEKSRQFEDFVCVYLARQGIVIQNYGSQLYQYRVGENLQGVEIKLDRRFLETGRLSIEIAEKSRSDRPDWTPSGIYRQDNGWLYLHGNYQRLYVFAKRTLQELHKRGCYDEGVYQQRLKKFYIPVEEADFYCAHSWRPGWIEGKPLPLR